MEVWIDEGLAGDGEVTLWFYTLGTGGHMFFFNYPVSEWARLVVLFRCLSVLKITLASSLSSRNLARLTFLSEQFDLEVRNGYDYTFTKEAVNEVV